MPLFRFTGEERPGCLNFDLFALTIHPILNMGLTSAFFDRLRRHAAVTLFFYAWIMMGALLSNAYRGNLLASLVKVEREKPVNHYEVI